ncbi:MAG: GAF domain-containing sensor histidine kinase [Pseudobdellovibrionaceae bacterium]
MTDSPLNDEKSFSLTKKLPTGEQKPRVPDNTSLSWQEQAYDRLKVLYEVSKLLSTFENVEKTFPKILDLCSTSFPFRTAVLIEKRGKSVMAAMWNAESVTAAQITLATTSSKESFIYLTGASKLESATLRSSEISSRTLAHVQTRTKSENKDNESYIVLPLYVDQLPAFGVLQLGGAPPLCEKDVEFVDALSNLVAIAIDRYYRVQYERELKDEEALESSHKLSRSEASVTDLETERELRENFVSLLSHDLRTPLSAARISAQLIQREANITEPIRSLASRIVSNMNRVDQMISDLLDANRIRSGEKLPLNIEPFDLVALVRRTLEELSTIHGERFVLKVPEILDGYWDKSSIRRIIENLCNNAVKYGSPDAPIILSLSQTNDQMTDQVTIEVQNTGDLISPEDQKTLFQQFRRSQKAQGSGKKGWGIGLTLVRGVAEAHGGTVKVASDAQRGTVFTVTLPIDSRPFISKEGT